MKVIRQRSILPEGGTFVLGSGLGDYADDIRVVDNNWITTTSRASRYRLFRDIKGTFYLRICWRSSGGVHAGKSSLL